MKYWYKDRDFSEVKSGNDDIVAVIENKDQLQRVIDDHNDLLNKLLECAKALKFYSNLEEENLYAPVGMSDDEQVEYLKNNPQLLLKVDGGRYAKETLEEVFNFEKD